MQSFILEQMSLSFFPLGSFENGLKNKTYLHPDEKMFGTFELKEINSTRCTLWNLLKLSLFGINDEILT